jgi:hypothetical protein
MQPLSPANRITRSDPAIRWRTELDVQTGALLLLLTAVDAILKRRLRLPYSVGYRRCRNLSGGSAVCTSVSLPKDLIFCRGCLFCGRSGLNDYLGSSKNRGVIRSG